MVVTLEVSKALMALKALKPLKDDRRISLTN